MQPATDLLQFEAEPVKAKSGKRFLNYLVDWGLFYMALVLYGLFLAVSESSFADDLGSFSSNYPILDWLLTMVMYAVYMGAMEAIFKGKTLGKLLTKTRAVNLDGSILSTRTAFLRGFTRTIPFAAFSALGSPCYPWWDRWTGTVVMDEKRTAEAVALPADELVYS